MSGFSSPNPPRGRDVAMVRSSLPSRLSTVNRAVWPGSARSHGLPGSEPRTQFTAVTPPGPVTVTLTTSFGIASSRKTL